LGDLKRVALFRREEKEPRTRSKTIMEQVQEPTKPLAHTQALFIGGK